MGTFGRLVPGEAGAPFVEKQVFRQSQTEGDAMRSFRHRKEAEPDSASLLYFLLALFRFAVFLTESFYGYILHHDGL
jgi:hypothetical protein